MGDRMDRFDGASPTVASPQKITDYSTLQTGDYVYVEVKDRNGKPIFLRAKAKIDNTQATPPDADGDGVADTDDTCPNTPSGATVDANGCADSQKDTDGDGVKDDVDCAPNDPNYHTSKTYYKGVDNDGDGYIGAVTEKDSCIKPNGYTETKPDVTDCNDNNADIHPGATEVSGNGVDENCDGEDAQATDTDGDGVADTNDTCPNTPSGATVDADGCADSQKDTDGDGIKDDVDCAPNNPNYHTSKTYYKGVDNDGDGYIGSVTEKESCVKPNGYTETKPGITDCNDNNADIHPGATEVPGNGIDENCDGKDEKTPDADKDGIPDSKDKCPNTPSGATVDGNGCADSQKDTDGDGVKDDKDCAPNDANYHTSKTYYKGVDNDGDGYIGAVTEKESCVKPNGYTETKPDITDCNDNNADIHPGATEVPGNGVDENCDGKDAQATDTDGDGVSDKDEKNNGTNPNKADSDDDGISDGKEGTKDTDGDGIIDALESNTKDSDGDGIVDYKDKTNTKADIVFTFVSYSVPSCLRQTPKWTKEQGCDMFITVLFSADKAIANDRVWKIYDSKNQLIEQAKFENQKLVFKKIPSLGKYTIEKSEGSKKVITLK